MGIFSNFFNFNKNTSQPVIPTEKTGYHNFTTQFLEVGNGNLSMPVINNQYTTSGYVRFGNDNLYPNLLRQLYHTSPLHSSIINYITNATVGGDYVIDGPERGIDKVKLYKFANEINLPKFIKGITRDALVFGVINIQITNDSTGTAVRAKRIPMDELRWDEEMLMYTYSKDFLRNHNGAKIEKYVINKPNHTGIYSVRMDDGDTTYPIPSYCSANNWIMLDGEQSFLHKSNIQNSIFPSYVIKFPKKPASQEEADAYRQTIESGRGAKNGGRVLTFFENGLDQLPIIEPLPSNQNDKLFLQTSDQCDNKICQAHAIAPSLMGIMVSGKLGMTNNIRETYTIFEKNTILPLRKEIENIVNHLMDIYGVTGTFAFKNYQIIGDVIVETKNNNDKLIEGK